MSGAGRGVGVGQALVLDPEQVEADAERRSFHAPIFRVRAVFFTIRRWRSGDGYGGRMQL